MLMYIPKVGDEIKISKNLEVTIQSEYRNEKFLKSLNLNNAFNNFILKENTQLKIERVYVRAGDSSDFDSVTFKILMSDQKELVGSRFWLNLDDVNRIEFDLLLTKNKPKDSLSYKILRAETNFSNRSLYGNQLDEKIISNNNIKSSHCFKVNVPKPVIHNIIENKKDNFYAREIQRHFDRNSNLDIFSLEFNLYNFSDEILISIHSNFSENKIFYDLKQFQKDIKGNNLPYLLPIAYADKNFKETIIYEKDNVQLKEREFFKFFRDLKIQ